MNNFTYDAFISYRHTDPDGYVAKKLHKELEALKIPSNIKKQLLKENPNSRVKITRVFRDEEELPLVSNLADPIVEAINNSDFLIVICSPRLKESIWCKKEIDTFLSIKDRNHVLAVLVEGEPSESFPEALLYREVEVTNPDGTTSIVREPTEPLAADVRATTNKERDKKIKAEVLRLAAPMFGVNFDDLRQRHKEQRMRRIMSISIACSLVFLIFGIVSTFLALKIKNQNTQILEQSAQISAQSEEISAQAEEIKVQYKEALVRNAESEASLSNVFFDKGDRVKALETAYGVFPEDLDDENMPYVSEVEMAGVAAMHLYDDGYELSPLRNLKLSTNGTLLKFSPDGDKILATEDSCRITVWDVLTGEKLCDIPYEGSVIYDEREVFFISDDEFVFSCGNGVAIASVSENKIVKIIEIGDVVHTISVNHDKTKLAAYGYSNMYVIDLDKQDIVNRTENSAFETILSYGSKFLHDDQYLAYAIRIDDDMRIDVVDADTLEPVFSDTLSFGLIDTIVESDGYFYVAASSSDYVPDSITIYDMSSELFRYDLQGNRTSLYTIDDLIIDKVGITQGAQPRIIIVGYNTIDILDLDGNYQGTLGMGTEILDLFYYQDVDMCAVMLRDGTWDILIPAEVYSQNYSRFNSATSNNNKCLTLGGINSICASLPYASNEITLYGYIKSDELVKIRDIEEYAYDMVAFPGKNMYMTLAYNDLDTVFRCIDSNSGDELWHFVLEDAVIKDTFLYDNRVYAVCTDAIYQVDADTGELLEECPLSIYSGLFAYSDDYSVMFADDRESALEIDMTTGEIIGKIEGADPDCYIYKSSTIVSLDTTENRAVLYKADFENGTAEQIDELAINASFVENVFSDDEGRVLFISYENGDLEAYPLNEDGSIDTKKDMKKFSELYSTLNDIVMSENGEYGVLVGDRSYMFRYTDGDLATLELCEQIRDFQCLDTKTDEIILFRADTEYKGKLYSVSELHKMMKEALGK